MTIQILTVAVKQLTAVVASMSMLLAGLTGQVADLEDQSLKMGATLPKVVASFESSLATKITSSATSMTLAKGTDDAGNALNGYICFVIDEGTVSREFVCGTASSTAVTSMIRGIDMEDADLEVAALKKSHRRGSSVKIADYPVLGVLMRIMNGDETLPNKLTYASQPTIDADEDIATKKYVDDVSISGAADASFTSKGIVEVATRAEVVAGGEASTSDTTAFLVVPSSWFDTTSSATTTVPVTNIAGKLDQTFYNLAENWTWTSTTTNATSIIAWAEILNGVLSVDNATSTNLTATGNSLLGTITEAIIGAGLTWNVAQDMNSVALTNVNIDSGNLTVTESTSTNLTVTGNIIGGTITQATIGAGLTWSENQDMNNVNLTNIDINSGAIDGTTIGASSASTAKFSNATSTNLELSTQLHSLGTLIVDGLSNLASTTLTLLTSENISSNNVTSTNLDISTQAHSLGTWIVDGLTNLASTTLTLLTAENIAVNNATSTNFDISTQLHSLGTLIVDGIATLTDLVVTNATSTNITATGYSKLGNINEATINVGLTWSAAQDFGSQNLTNMDIDSGTIDSTTIGAGTPSTGIFSNSTSTNAEATSLKTATLKLGNTVVSSSADELNKLDTTSANVTATNLNTLTDGSSQTTLHRHIMDTGREATTTDGEWLIPHNLGVVPSMIEITAMSFVNSTEIISFGSATSTSAEGCLYSEDNGSSVTHGQSTVKILLLEDATNDGWDGSLTTLDATNIGITLIETDTANSGTVSILWKAWF